MPKRDFNQTAFDTVRIATGEVAKPIESVKAASGRKGGLKGGAARSKALPATKRSEIAKKAASARWKGR